MSKGIIIQSGNQINAQHQTSPLIPILPGKYPKDFQMPNHIFNQHPLPCQLLVRRLLRNGQFSAFWLFERRSTLLVQLPNTLITGIRQTFGFLRQAHFTCFIERKVVSRSFGKSRVQNAPGAFADANLCFHGVPLFLARIIAALFLFGRSTAVSTTSTTTTSTSGGRFSRRLTGKWNSCARLKIFSTRVIMRETVDSDIPQLLAMWNIVRYSRKYSKVNNTWSQATSFAGLPETNLCAANLWRTIPHILSKVFRPTPQYRLKSVLESSFSFS